MFLTSLVSLCLVVAGAAVSNNAVHHTHGSHFKKAKHSENTVQFKHRLRVCNAYPHAEGLDVLRGREQMTKAPLEYKMCGDFASQLLAGDKLKFMVGDANAGTFTISDLPNNDAVLLLVIYRHDTLSNAVAFKSHVFANLLNAQIAVIDTYKGRARSFAEITDGSKKEEKLRYNSVVALNPGEYKVNLMDNHGKKQVAEDLVALNRESYVIIRTGVEAQQGPEYPQDIIVYPMSDKHLLHSSSHTSLPTAFLMAVLVLAALRQ